MASARLHRPRALACATAAAAAMQLPAPTAAAILPMIFRRFSHSPSMFTRSASIRRADRCLSAAVARRAFSSSSSPPSSSGPAAPEYQFSFEPAEAPAPREAARARDAWSGSNSSSAAASSSSSSSRNQAARAAPAPASQRKARKRQWDEWEEDELVQEEEQEEEVENDEDEGLFDDDLGDRDFDFSEEMEPGMRAMERPATRSVHPEDRELPPPQLDKILLTNLQFYSYHGVHLHEFRSGQPFEVDLELYADLTRAGVSDDLDETVDYSRVVASVEEVMQRSGKHKLLERLALLILDAVFLDFPRVQKITVRLRKPKVGLKAFVDYAGVELTRERIAVREDSAGRTALHRFVKLSANDLHRLTAESARDMLALQSGTRDEEERVQQIEQELGFKRIDSPVTQNKRESEWEVTS